MDLESYPTMMYVKFRFSHIRNDEMHELRLMQDFVVRNQIRKTIVCTVEAVVHLKYCENMKWFYIEID